MWYKIKFNTIDCVIIIIFMTKKDFEACNYEPNIYINGQSIDAVRKESWLEKMEGGASMRRKFPTDPTATDFRVLFSKRMFAKRLPDIEMINSYRFAIEITPLDKRSADKRSRQTTFSRFTAVLDKIVADKDEGRRNNQEYSLLGCVPKLFNRSI